MHFFYYVVYYNHHEGKPHLPGKMDPGDRTVEIRVWAVPKAKDKPHGYKYSLVYIKGGARIVGYDNAEGRGDHRHYGGKEEPYQFTDLDTLMQDFYDDVGRYWK